MKKFSTLFLLAVLMPCLSHGEGHEHHPDGKSQSGIVDLSPGLRDLISREMRHLEKGMAEIFPLYFSGKWGEIVPIANNMKNSYILKQSLSEEQMHELHSKVPGGFVELDQQFHYLSGMLGHAAEMEKAELVGFYYAKMTEACVSCHTRYATHRFPALAPGIKAHRH